MLTERPLFSVVPEFLHQHFPGCGTWFTACLMDYFPSFLSRAVYILTLVSAEPDRSCWIGYLPPPQGHIWQQAPLCLFWWLWKVMLKCVSVSVICIFRVVCVISVQILFSPKCAPSFSNVTSFYSWAMCQYVIQNMKHMYISTLKYLTNYWIAYFKIWTDIHVQRMMPNAFGGPFSSPGWNVPFWII